MLKEIQNQKIEVLARQNEGFILDEIIKVAKYFLTKKILFYLKYFSLFAIYFHLDFFLIRHILIFQVNDKLSAYTSFLL